MGNDTQHDGHRSFGRALYYPYFCIQDVNWLKAALLYWDEISTIVPHGYAPTDPEEIKPAREFILPLDPKPYIQQAEDVFRQHILPLVDQPDCSKVQEMLKSVAAAIGDRHVWIHANKMTHGLREELEQRGVLQHWPNQKMFLEQGFDALYMICLAKEMGIATRRPPLTDAKEYAECQTLLQFDAGPSIKHGEPDEDSTSLLMQLGIALPSPDQLAHVSLETVLDHHRSRQDERRAFRQATEGILAEATSMSNPTILADYLTDRRRKIEKQVSDYRKTLDEINVSAIESALKVSVPAWFVTAGSMIGGFESSVTGILTSLGIAISAIAWWAKVRQDRRQAVASCPWHYWTDTQQQFTRA